MQNEFKAMMDNLYRRKMELSKNLKAFQKIQTEVHDLVEKAKHSPEAAKKLEKINKSLGHDYNRKKKELEERIIETRSQLSVLDKKFKQFSNIDDLPLNSNSGKNAENVTPIPHQEKLVSKSIKKIKPVKNYV